MKIFTYSRKSRFTGKGESIENQKTLCRDYSLSRIPDAKEEDILPFEDEGFSGKNTARPQFQQMMKQIRAAPPDYLVCYRLDRISRSVGDFSALIEELSALKVSFICIREQFDTSTPMGRAMMYIASVFAQLERETIAERIRDNMYLLARSGRWLGGVTPTGFASQREQTVTPDGKTRAAYRLVPVPEELEVVRLVYRRFLAEESISGTAKYLNSQGFHSKLGKAFGVESVKSILRNPVYAAADEQSAAYWMAQDAQICFTDRDCEGHFGFMPFNRSGKGAHGRVPKDISEWIIAVGRHQGIISGRDWVRAQSLLNEKQAKAKRVLSAPVSSALLSGVLRCGGCGSRMRPRIFSGYIKKDGAPAFYYACSAKEAEGTSACAMGNANGYLLEEAVWKALLCFSPPAAGFLPSLRRLRMELTATDSAADSRSILLERMKRNRVKIQNLIEAIAQGETDPSVMSCIKEQIRLLRQQCRTDDAALAALSPVPAKTQNSADFHLIPGRFFSNFDQGASPGEKRRLIASAIQRILWDGENAHLFLR